MRYAKECYQIVNAAYEVRKHLGRKFSEKVYQDALAVEFAIQGIPFEREKHVSVIYKDHVLDHDYFLDFFCFDKIVVELKAYNEHLGDFDDQVINYLQVGNFELGILLNFGLEDFKPKYYPNYN